MGIVWLCDDGIVEFKITLLCSNSERELKLDFVEHSSTILVDFKLISKTLPDVEVQEVS